MGKTAEVHEPVVVGSNIEGQTVHTSTGTMRHRPDRMTMDESTVTDRKRAEWGIRDDEALQWTRDGSKWEQFEGIDRQEQFIDETGGRLVRTSEFDKVKRGVDLVLMAYPKEVEEQRRKEIDAANQAYEQDLIPDDDDPHVVRSHRDLFDRAAFDLHARMRYEHERNARSGFVGGNSPTAGLTLAQAEALMARRGVDVEAMQADLRRGGRHVQMNASDFSNMIAGEKAERRTSRTVAMGDSGFPRNPNSAVAQAARKAKP